MIIFTNLDPDSDDDDSPKYKTEDERFEGWARANHVDMWRYRNEDPNQLELPIPWNSPDADPLKDMHDVGEASRKRWLNGPPPGDPNPYACLGRDVEDDDEKQ